MLAPKDYFKPIHQSDKNDEYIAIESKTFAQDVWARFCKNKRALFGLICLVIILLIAVIGPFLSPYPYDGMDTSIMNLGSSMKHWFGTDKFGRDIFTRVLYGARISLLIGFTTAAINLVIGVVYGGIAGYSGGKRDMWMMRIVDVIYAIPAMLYIIMIMLIFGSNIGSILLGVCVSGWIDMARLVRAQVLTLKNQEFSLAAFVIGASKKRILFRHLLINALGPIIVSVTFMIPQAIFMEAFLSFIGIGISAPMASLGTLAQDAKTYIAVYPTQMLYPIATICITIFSLNFIGEGLGKALNPKEKR